VYSDGEEGIDHQLVGSSRAEGQQMKLQTSTITLRLFKGHFLRALSKTSVPKKKCMVKEAHLSP